MVFSVTVKSSRRLVCSSSCGASLIFNLLMDGCLATARGLQQRARAQLETVIIKMKWIRQQSLQYRAVCGHIAHNIYINTNLVRWPGPGYQ